MSKDYHQLLNDLIYKEDLKILRAKRLIKKGADPNYPIDEYGKTIFMNAVERCNSDMIRLLLKKETDLDAVRNDRDNSLEVVQLLLESGSSMKILQETPRVCVCEYCQTQQYLPDEIWLKFYQPYKRRKRWYILFVEDE